MESVEGEGATFHLALPVLDQQEEVEYPHSKVRSRPGVPANNILVVDDESAVLDLVDTLLSSEGYQVDVAKDGEQAWDQIQNKAYDCIFLDLKMPNVSGEKFFKLVEGYDKNLASRIIFMTGDTFNLDSQRFLSTTGNRILEKPFVLKELQEHIVLKG